MTTRRKFVLGGIAAIIAAQRAPAALVRSLVAGRHIAATGTRLPYDADVEWLESTGTQWIDTGWLFQKNIRIVLDVRFTESTKAWLWGRNAANYEVLVGPSTTFYFGNSNGGASFSDNVDYTLDLDFTAGAMVAKVNGTVVKSTTGTQPTGTHIGLFSLWTYSNTTPNRMGSMRHKGITIYQGGEIVLNLKAVRFTNELGQSEGAMYDTANPTVGMNPDGSPRTDGLYRNRGTGSFVIGPVKARGASVQNVGGGV